MTRIYRLTREGKKLVRVPGPEREPILDHLYEFRTASLDELLALDKEARDKLRLFIGKGIVEEFN